MAAANLEHAAAGVCEPVALGFEWRLRLVLLLEVRRCVYRVAIGAAPALTCARQALNFRHSTFTIIARSKAIVIRASRRRHHHHCPPHQWPPLHLSACMPQYLRIRTPALGHTEACAQRLLCVRRGARAANIACTVVAIDAKLSSADVRRTVVELASRIGRSRHCRCLFVFLVLTAVQSSRWF
jgi:hypothetical protein